MESRESAALPSSPADDEEPRSPWPYVAIGIAVIAALVGAWMVRASVAEGAVAQVSVTGGLPRCEGVKVIQRRLEDDGPRLPVLALGRGMAAKDFRCTTAVTITNDGDRTVHLDRMSFPFQAPETGVVVTIDFVDDDWSTGDVENSNNAVRNLDRDLGAGETATFTIDHVFNGQGCSDSVTMTLRPTLEASVWGHGVEVDTDYAFAFRHFGETPGCTLD